MFTIKSQAYDGRYLEVVCLQTPNVAENTSEIAWTLTVTGGNSSWYSTGPTTLTIGGEQVYFCKRKSYTSRVFPAAKGAVSGKLTVPHDEDGSCRVQVRLETAIYTQTLSAVEETWELAPIERAALIRASDARIGSCATVVVTRRSEAFWHSISYAFGHKTGWLDSVGDPVETEVRYSESILNFRLPEAFYEAIPNSPQGSCQLTCITYRDNRKVGESRCSFTVSADPALCCPVVTGSVAPLDETTLRLTDGKLIPGISTAGCTVEAAARYGAQLVSVTAGGVPVEGGQAVLQGWALDTVPVVAVDSRGFQTSLELPSPCISYTQLTLIPEAVRRSPTADEAVLTLRGACFVGNFGKAENSLEAVAEFDGRRLEIPLTVGEDGYEATAQLPELLYTRSYPVTVTVADRAMTVTATVTVRKGLPVFYWGENEFCFHVPVDVPALTVGGIPLERYIQATAASEPQPPQ